MARRELHTEIEIDASPERVWAELIDFDSYPDWNPFIVEISGTPVKNAKIRVASKPPGSKTFQFRPRILVCQENEELRWIGRVWFTGIFDGEHRLQLERLEGNRTRFIQQEKFKGILVGLFRKTLDRTQQGFEQMNKALKQRAER